MRQHVWFEHYVNGTNSTIDELPAGHLPAMMRANSEQYGPETAFTQCMPNGLSGSLSFAQVNNYSDAFACYLREVIGLQQGDRVAIQLPNCLSYPIIVFGVLKAGCVLVNTNPLYTPREMTHQFSDAGAKALVIIDMFTDRLNEVLPKTTIETVITVNIADFFPAIPGGLIRLVQKYIHKSIPKTSLNVIPIRHALAQGKAYVSTTGHLDAYLDDIGPDTLALLQYTGGTTGVSKGAMLSHGNLMANMMQMLEMMNTFIEEGQETVLTALPLYHIFAFTVNLMGFYFMGARNILIPSPRPAENLKKALEKYNITWFSGVNTLFNSMLQETWFINNPPKHLKASVAGGTSLHVSVADHWNTVVGSPIVEGYGLTESSPLLTVNPLGGDIRVGTIGIPAPSTEVRLVDDRGEEVAQGESGEVIAKGPQIMLGYWQRPNETSQALKDGWLYTGDVGVMSKDGFFTIVDRKKDMILISGFNVYPNEIEQCIAEHPDVVEVAAIGEPDDKSGERVKVFVVRKDDRLNKEALIAYCRKNLTSYKVPKSVEFLEELPKSAVGKILRKDLRKSEEAVAQTA